MSPCFMVIKGHIVSSSDSDGTRNVAGASFETHFSLAMPFVIVPMLAWEQ